MKTLEQVEMARRENCFGGEVAVHLSGPRAYVRIEEALAELHRYDRVLSRFRANSELTNLNDARGRSVPATELMLDLAEAIVWAGERSGGLVDSTLIGSLEDAGYTDSFGDRPDPIRDSGAFRAQPTRAALPAYGWRDVAVDRETGTIDRQPGLRLDSGGIGKGLAADLLGAELADAPTFCVDCSGDMLIGGRQRAPRQVRVEHPFEDRLAASFEIAIGGVATTGINRRAWRGPDGELRHHLLDPGRKVPAFTGIAQATAIAPTALEAEVLAKSALLSGPEHASEWLPYGGALVFSDGSIKAHPVALPAVPIGTRMHRAA